MEQILVPPMVSNFKYAINIKSEFFLTVNVNTWCARSDSIYCVLDDCEVQVFNCGDKQVHVLQFVMTHRKHKL